MKRYLTEDIRSNVDNSLHGSKGTEVSVLSKMGEHINVVIVADKEGNRFPVNSKFLSEQKSKS